MSTPLKTPNYANILNVNPAIGEPGKVLYIPLKNLGIDETYQRKITNNGHKNIKIIAESFDWKKFIPVIVRKHGKGNKYDIIDGQHRATAALIREDIEKVPCMVIDASAEEAARCFAAINGQVTAMTPLSLYKARLAGKEPFAIKIDDVCRRAGVTIIASKPMNQSYGPGQTMSIGAIEKNYKKHGEHILNSALVSISQTGDGNPGELRSEAINAMCAVFSSKGIAGRLNLSSGDVCDMMDEFDFSEARISAQVAAHDSPLTKAEALLSIIEKFIRQSYGQEGCLAAS